jgi:hypothetical protein
MYNKTYQNIRKYGIVLVVGGLRRLYAPRNAEGGEMVKSRKQKTRKRQTLSGKKSLTLYQIRKYI